MYVRSFVLFQINHVVVILRIRREAHQSSLICAVVMTHSLSSQKSDQLEMTSGNGLRTRNDCLRRQVQPISDTCSLMMIIMWNV